MDSNGIKPVNIKSSRSDLFDQIRVSFKKISANETPSKYLMTLCLGKNIAEKIGIQEKDIIKFYSNSIEPCSLLIKKSDDNTGYLVRKPNRKSGIKASPYYLISATLSQFTPRDSETALHTIQHKILEDAIKINLTSSTILEDDLQDFAEVNPTKIQLSSSKPLSIFNRKEVVRVSFRKSPKYKSSPPRYYLRMTIGKNIADSIGIQDGDKIKFYMATADSRVWLITKSDNDVGYKLEIEKSPLAISQLIYTVRITWSEFTPSDSEMPVHIVEHEIVENGIKIYLNNLNNKSRSFTDFKEIKPKRNVFSKFDALQKIRVYFCSIKARDRKLYCLMMMYLGKKLAAKVGIHSRDKINFYIAEDNPYIWFIKKSNNNIGYTAVETKLRRSNELSSYYLIRLVWHKFTPVKSEILTNTPQYKILNGGIKISLSPSIRLDDKLLNFVDIKPPKNKSTISMLSKKIQRSNEVYISFPAKRNNKKLPSRLIMRIGIGKNIAEKIGIHAGDKIKFYVSSNDARVWLIKKSNNDIGFKVQNIYSQSGKPTFYYEIRIPCNKFKPKKSEASSHLVQHEIFKNSVIINLKGQKHKSINFKDFIEIKNPHNKSPILDSLEKVRVSFPFRKTKGISKHFMMLYLGKKLAKSIGIKGGDKVKFCIAENNPRIWFIKKSDDNVGYSVINVKHQAKRKPFNYYIIQITWNKFTPKESEIPLHVVEHKNIKKGIKITLTSSTKLDNRLLKFTEIKPARNKLFTNKLNRSEAVSISFLRVKNNNKSHQYRMMLYLGKTIAKRAGILTGDRVKLYVSRSNTRIWLIKRSDDGVGYKLQDQTTPLHNTSSFLTLTVYNWRKFTPTKSEVINHVVKHKILKSGIKIYLKNSSKKSTTVRDFIDIITPRSTRSRPKKLT